MCQSLCYVFSPEYLYQPPKKPWDMDIIIPVQGHLILLLKTEVGGLCQTENLGPIVRIQTQLLPPEQGSFPTFIPPTTAIERFTVLETDVCSSLVFTQLKRRLFKKQGRPHFLTIFKPREGDKCAKQIWLGVGLAVRCWSNRRRSQPFPGSLGRHWALMKLRVSELTLRRNEPTLSFGSVWCLAQCQKEEKIICII